jgi:integrase
MDAGDAVELFLQSRVARGAADSTLRTYRKALSLFARFYPLTRDGVLAFVADLRSRQLSPHTVASYIRALKAFLRFLADEGLIAWRLDLRPPRADRTPKAIREEDQLRMIRAAKGRDRAMLLLLYDTGMRASELLSLRWEQIDLAGRRIWLRGKGGRARTVFFTPRTARALAALPRTDPVFPSPTRACARSSSAWPSGPGRGSPTWPTPGTMPSPSAWCGPGCRPWPCSG